jgi:hypothetical protein
LSRYLSEQLKNMNSSGADLFNARPSYRLLESDDFYEHPVFGSRTEADFSPGGEKYEVQGAKA